MLLVESLRNSRRKDSVKSRSEGCQDLVRFFALLRIKPHAPPLVRVPVNSFEFHSCERTPQVEYLLDTAALFGVHPSHTFTSVADQYKGNNNFEYDLVDIVRQSNADKGNVLLEEISQTSAILPPP